MNWWLFFPVFARIFALMQTAPLLSSRSVPFTVRGAVALCTAFCAVPALEGIMTVPEDPAAYYTLVAGEALIGAAMGFFLRIVFSVMSCAGHFMGIFFGDMCNPGKSPVSELLNYAGVFVFVAVSGIYSLFCIGITASFKAITAYDILVCRTGMTEMLVSGFTGMFAQALLTALPVLAVLAVVTLVIGILRLLDFGWSLTLLTGVLVLVFAIPFIMDSFGQFINSGFDTLTRWISEGGSL